ncbi:MAG: hypothetical protein KBF78_09210 [Fuscovulum sp.]|nr:hypothetical protein [Fuscovulum sp.]
MTDCDPLIDDPFLFPRRPANRPALPRIGYRIGEYPDFVEAMLRGIDGEVALAAWTHRGADDPGIALLEGVGILGDILTFYQERYANEAFLRTALWRESVAGLVRLLGYRLSPGLGGTARLAVELKPAAGRVVVPAGFPFKADLDGQDLPAEFQTDAELVAHAHLSRFNLFRPRSYAPVVAALTTRLEVDRAGGNAALAAIAALGLKKGDRLLLQPDAPAWVTNPNAAFAEQDSFQVLAVKEVQQLHDRTIVTFDTPLARGWSLPLTAWRLGRTWRHFGHAAPPTHTVVSPTTGTVTGATTLTTYFLRHLSTNHDCANTSMATDIPGAQIPLDQEVADLVPGRRIAVETLVRRDGAALPCVFVRTVMRLRGTAMTFGPQTGPSTVLTMGAGLLTHGQVAAEEADIRDYRIHEITSPAIRLRPVATASGGAFATGTEALAFYGTRAQARTLVDRPLMLKHDDGRWQELTCVNEATDFPWVGTDPKMWLLSFDAPPAPFLRGDFDEEAPRVTVFGNLATASQGKAVAEVVLGNGDARAVFQTFPLPKPVTHLLRPGADPAEVPELTVRVNGRAVDRVASLYGQPPDRLVHVLRQDDDGSFHVQFGDGVTGARLPSGRGNVTATFRTGSGARGVLKPGAQPGAGTRIEGVAKLHLPGEVTGGADPETEATARVAAPGRVQGLGRIVSLADYETELLAIPGVSRVRAAWDMLDGAPGVVLRVLLQSGRETEFEAVRAAILSFQRCRGSNRFGIEVRPARLRQVFLDLRYAFDPGLLQADVAAAITRRLAPMDLADADPGGVFALAARGIGETEYASRIEGRVQAVPGVLWARVDGFGKLPATPAGDPPDSLDLPPAPRPRAAQAKPLAGELLQLHGAHLTLVSAPPPPGGTCA